jgi:hypothetical protein
MPEIYISTDVEADGPIPGPHSMLSMGAAAFREDKTLIKMPHNHVAVDDAVGQGVLFCNILAEVRRRVSP